jgi:hypothetical protein
MDKKNNPAKNAPVKTVKQVLAVMSDHEKTIFRYAFFIVAALIFVVRPMLMSMVRREPNLLELEEMAQLAVNSAFKEKFAGFYAAHPVARLEAPQTQATAEGDASISSKDTAQAAPEPLPLTEEELLAYVEGELNPDRADTLSLQLLSDPELFRRLEQMRINRSVLMSLPQELAPPDLMERVTLALRAAGYHFYDWPSPPGETAAVVRLVTSYDMTAADVDGFLAVARRGL